MANKNLFMVAVCTLAMFLKIKILIINAPFFTLNSWFVISLNAVGIFDITSKNCVTHFSGYCLIGHHFHPWFTEVTFGAWFNNSDLFAPHIIWSDLFHFVDWLLKMEKLDCLNGIWICVFYFTRCILCLFSNYWVFLSLWYDFLDKPFTMPTSED